MLKYKNVDEYIAKADIKSQPILNEIREVIRLIIPESEEVISYGVPFYKYSGQLGGFAVYKAHVSVGFGVESMTDNVKKNLLKKGYDMGKGTFKIKFNQSVPVEELKEIIKTKVIFNELE